MVGVGDQRLRVEDVASDKFANCHRKVGDQADPRNPNAGVVLVCGSQVHIAAVVMVMVTAVATMASGLRRHQM